MEFKDEQSKINHLINPGMQNLSYDNSWSFEGGKGATPSCRASSWSRWRQVALIKKQIEIAEKQLTVMQQTLLVIIQNLMYRIF